MLLYPLHDKYVSPEPQVAPMFKQTAVDLVRSVVRSIIAFSFMS